MNNVFKRLVSVTELRRNFGKITANLAKIDSLILTRGGEPFAILKATPGEKIRVLKKVAGAWKGTALDNDGLWEQVAKKKSRKTRVKL